MCRYVAPVAYGMNYQSLETCDKGCKLNLMMTALQLRDRLNEQPFKPFRITMSDGRSFDVPNHDAAFVKKNIIEIGINLDANSFSEKYVSCAILHITSIEDVSAEKAA
jgi:hypothetical protein